MNIIANLRGTSGSGKSTVVFTLLKKHPHEELIGPDYKIKGYVVNAKASGIKEPIYIMGEYTSACGGADKIKTQQEAADRCVFYVNKGHVFIEGLLASAAGPTGALTKAIQDTGKAKFLIMDTPIDVCLDRVRQRRLSKGNDKPLNEKNTRAKWDQTMRAARSLDKLGYDVRPISYDNAYEEVIEIFREAEREPL